MTAPAAIETVVRNLRDNFSLALHENQGANGYIYFGKNLILDSDIVLKFYYWADEKRAHMEPQVMQNIDHKNVLKVVHAGFGDEDWAYFVTPFMKGGNIDKLLDNKSYSLLEAVKIAAGIASGLCELHGNHILHRDLKAANVFLNGQDPVIGDFGSIMHIADLRAHVVSASKHSILYRPPEAVSDSIFSVQSDIYQVGLILFQLCGGRLDYDEVAWLSKSEALHFATLSYPENTLFADECICRKIVSGKLVDIATVRPYIPKSVKSIIKTCCHTSPSKLYDSASQLLIALNTLIPQLCEWRMMGDEFRLDYKGGAYSFARVEKGFIVRKRKGSGQWMNQHTFVNCTSEADVIQKIEQCV